MGSKATSLALVRDSDGLVETFVRLDVPATWTPGVGLRAVPDDELPAGWQMAPDPSAPVPDTISARQARIWLVQHAIPLATVDAVIASITDEVTRETVRIDWEYGTEVRRSSPWIAALAPVLGLDDATLDQAFREAASL